MKIHAYPLLLVFVHIVYMASAQNTAPSVTWQKTIGGSGSEVLTAVCIDANKSILLCGYSNSGISGYKSKDSIGKYDFWIVKLDARGSKIWDRTYGGRKDDYASAIISTSDGGYLVGGSSISDSSSSKSSNSYGFSYDYWVLKLDVHGRIMWDKTMGGLYTDQLTSLAELPAGGYLVGGYSYSQNTGSKTTVHTGPESNADYWTVILNNDGTERAQYEYGSDSHDVLTCVSPSGINGFYVGGYSYSKKGGNKTTKNYGNDDYWILHSDLTGKIKYEGDFGGKLSDYLTCMQVLPDSSLILGGYSNSGISGIKSGGFFGVTDLWLLKLKPDGTKQWDKTIAGARGKGLAGDYLVSVQQTKDKGFILGSYSNSALGRNKTANSKGGYDYWIVKVDSAGNVQWDKTIGGNRDDLLTAVYEVDSGKYVVAGTSASKLSGDKSSDVIGGGKTTDFWLLKLSAAQLTEGKSTIDSTEDKLGKPSAPHSRYTLEVTPNPVKKILTIQYNAPESTKINFVIYTAGGKAILQSALAAASATGTKSFDIAGFPAGSYFAVLYAGATKLTKMFTKE